MISYPDNCTALVPKCLLSLPSLLKQVESVEFTVWDIGGPASMATVNQCFFTDKALYVVVWNLALGEEAVANLQFWLLNIEVRRCQPALRLPVLRVSQGSATSLKHPPSLREKKRTEKKWSGRNTLHLGWFSEDPGS